MPPSKARIITALALAASGLLVLGPSPAQAATAAGAFTAVQPFRLANKVVVPGGGSVNVSVAGVGGVPSTGAGAVVLNVTVTEPQRSGYVTAFPTGSGQPATSNLNFVAGQTIANHVTVRLGSGKVTLHNGSPGSVKLIADLAGWYVTSGASQQAGTFTPLQSPARLMNKAPVGGGGTLPLTIAGRAGVPSSGVGAGALNLAVTQPTASGYIAAYPYGTTRPGVSNLNFSRNQTIANAATVKLGTDNKSISLYNGSPGSAALIADIAGWFKGGDGTVAGSYNPEAPTRLLNKVVVPAGESITLQVAGKGGVPETGAAAAVLNLTVTEPGASGYVSAYPTGSPRPGVSNINFVAAQTIANLATVKLGSHGKVNFFNGSTEPVKLIADLAGWYNAGPAPAQVSSITNWANWKLTLPVDANWQQGNDKTAVEIKQGGTPDLATFQDPAWFHMNDTENGVVFRANAGGATTAGSNFPRSELREMNGSSNAGWSNASGTHTMTLTQAITHLPDNKNQVVAGQVHDGGPSNGGIGDILVVRLNGNRLFAKANGTDITPNLDSNYVLGTKFTVEIQASPTAGPNGQTGISVKYWKTGNTASPPDTTIHLAATTNYPAQPWFFKAGCYTQSNTSNDASTAYGEVVIYDLDVTHS